MEDAPSVAALAGDASVAEMTLLIPHPYVIQHAIDWFATHAGQFAAGASAQFAITDRAGGTLMGSIGIEFQARHAKAEIGYWIGRPFWGRGYATEAGRAVVRWAFESRGVERVESFCFTKNTASARVLEKIGLRREGLARGYLKKGSERMGGERAVAAVGETQRGQRGVRWLVGVRVPDQRWGAAGSLATL